MPGTQSVPHRHRFFGTFMSIPPMLCVFRQQKKPHPKFGTRLPSCGTTQVDAFAPARFRVLHTRRPDNGCGPRRSLLVCTFAPPSPVHSPKAPCRDPTARGSLKGCPPGYYSDSSVFLIVLHYMRGRLVCQVQNPLLVCVSGGQLSSIGAVQDRHLRLLLLHIGLVSQPA